jgi:hypothetical protein
VSQVLYTLYTCTTLLLRSCSQCLHQDSHGFAC